MSIDVTYNGASLPNVVDSYDFGSNYETATFTCHFLVTASSSFLLNSARKNIEDKLREPLEDLTIVFSGNTHRTFSHSNNTGMNARVSFSPTDVLSTETAQSMKFKYTCQLPADKNGFDFRQNSKTTVSKSPSGSRTVSVVLTYTAGGSDSASENFDSFAEPFAENILDNLGGSGIYDLVSNNRGNDDQDKVCSGTLVYKEILDDQTESLFNHADIFDAKASYSLSRRQSIGISQTGGYTAQTMTMVSVNYSCTIASSVTVANTESLYRTLIKPWIIKHSKDVVGLSQVTDAGLKYITQNDDITYDPTTSTVSGRMSFFAPISSQITELSETIQTQTNEGRLLDKLWNQKKNSYLVSNYGSTETVIRNIMVKQLDTPPAKPLDIPDNTLLLLDSSESETIVKDGESTGFDFPGVVERVKIFEKSFQEIYRRIDIENSIIIDSVITPEQS